MRVLCAAGGSPLAPQNLWTTLGRMAIIGLPQLAPIVILLTVSDFTIVTLAHQPITTSIALVASPSAA